MNTEVPRIGLCGIALENNSFSPVTTEADFRSAIHIEGAALLAEARKPVSNISAEMSAFVQAMDATVPWKPVPLLLAANPPWGPAEDGYLQVCYDTIADGIAEAGGVDGVYLANHGAMVSTATGDPDGEMMARIREAAGPEAAIVATLDLHANTSERMVESADVLIGYLTNPHVDMRERGEEAAFAMRMIMAGMRPKSAFIRLPLTPPSVTLLTAEGPYADNDPVRPAPGARDGRRDPERDGAGWFCLLRHADERRLHHRHRAAGRAPGADPGPRDRRIRLEHAGAVPPRAHVDRGSGGACRQRSGRSPGTGADLFRCRRQPGRRRGGTDDLAFVGAARGEGQGRALWVLL